MSTITSSLYSNPVNSRGFATGTITSWSGTKSLSVSKSKLTALAVAGLSIYKSTTHYNDSERITYLQKQIAKHPNRTDLKNELRELQKNHIPIIGKSKRKKRK